jgi:hypothetical protein
MTAPLMVMGADPRSEAFFEFEHAMAHRQVLQAMAPFQRLSVLPYVLDPKLDTDMWAMIHQTAQDDFIQTSPTWGMYPTSLPPYPGTLPVAVGDSKNLIDEGDVWTTFVNWMEHYLGAATLAQVPPENLFPAW